jgi:hypothetical protein
MVRRFINASKIEIKKKSYRRGPCPAHGDKAYTTASGT